MENTYHRYLNLPFDIEPYGMFKEKGNEIKHLYIDDYHFPPIEKLFSDLDLILYLKEVFYTPPFSKIPIHTDHGLYTNHVKINITWGPEEGVIQWWRSDNITQKQMNDYGKITKETHCNLWAEEKDSQLLFEANTNKPSLVNVGILHGTNNPTPEGRWTLCFVPLKKKGRKFIDWYEGLEIFKDYIV